MSFTLHQLIKDTDKIDVEDILSDWQWLLPDQKGLVLVSCMGDLFLLGKDDAVNWLDTTSGKLTKVADSVEQFEQLLSEENNIDYWFLPLLVEELIAAGKILQENQVYSFKKPPIVGGEYHVDNIEPTDISVHFSFSGQLAKQIKDMPDGTKLKINFK